MNTTKSIWIYYIWCQALSHRPIIIIMNNPWRTFACDSWYGFYLICFYANCIDIIIYVFVSFIVEIYITCSDDYVTEIASNKMRQWHRVKNGSYLILWLMALPLLCVYLKWYSMSKHPRTSTISRFEMTILTYSHTIWNDNFHIHTLNKKNSRPHQQFETTFPRLFFWGRLTFSHTKTFDFTYHRKPVASQDYVSLIQNLEMRFSCWAQYIDSVETCQYPTVNSQISIFLWHSCRLLWLKHDEMPLF